MTMTLLVAAACNDQITPEVSMPSGEGIAYFTASTEADEDAVVEEDDTKTAISSANSRYYVVWNENDAISVRSGENTYQYTATPVADENGRNTAANFYPVQTDLVLPAGNHYALYPHSEDAVWNGSEVTFTIPEVQTCVPGSFPFNASVAATSDNSLAFKNVGALIKYKINATSYTKVVFEAVGGESLAGKVTVDCADPEDLTVVEGSSTLTLNGTNNNGYCYATVLPGTYSQGIRILMFSKDGYKSVRIGQLTLERNSRIETGDLLTVSTIQKDFQGKTTETTTVSTEDNYEYYSLACGIDVACEQIANGKGTSWETYCDPGKTLTEETAANLTLANVPANPCPTGWNLPTKAQLETLMNEAKSNTVHYREAQDCYWELIDGSRCRHNLIFGSTNMHLISSELNENGACYYWQFTYTKNAVTQYYELTANKVATRDRTNTGNNYAWYRCVRNTPQQ